MTWNKKAGKAIAKAKASEMIDKYQKEHPGKTQSVYFDNEILQELINTKGGAGLSFFFAVNDDGRNTLVIYAVDENGKKINDTTDDKSLLTTESTTPTSGGPVDVGSPCPPFCP